MKLLKNTSVADIQIWAPRYRDMVVLIAAFRVREHNKITFTKAKNYPGLYYLSGETIKKYPKEQIGKITCYAVHMDELEELTYA